MNLRDTLKLEAMNIFAEIGQDDETWGSIEYKGVIFDINVWYDEDADHYKASAYLVFKKNGYLEADLSCWIDLGYF